MKTYSLPLLSFLFAPLLIFVTFFANATPLAAQDDLCALPFEPVSQPLTDLGPGEYVRLESGPTGYTGGLYPNGQNVRPAAHEVAGLAQARQIKPRNAAGEPDPDGLIGLISIGMSNTFMEFRAFEDLAAADPDLNSRLAIVNGAQAGQVAQDWADPNSGAWQFLNDRLNHRRVSPQQVQVVWLKQVNTGPGDFPEKAQTLQADLTAIVENVKRVFPNVRIVYLSSRTRSYTYWNGLSPEPAAFESGFAVKWLIEQQIMGEPGLSFVEGRGETAVVPYLTWGPYLWADGQNPRADGFVWLVSDLRRDCTHPSPVGVSKIADELLAFFKTDSTSVPWFLNSATPDNELSPRRAALRAWLQSSPINEARRTRN